MAKPKVEIQIPKDLGLTRTQVSDLQKSFEKQRPCVEFDTGAATEGRPYSTFRVIKNS